MSQSKTFSTFFKFIVVIAVLGVAGYIWWTKSGMTVRVVSVVRENAPNAVPGSVTVSAERSIIVRSAIGGLVEEGTLEVGNRVKKGDFLIKLDTSDLVLEIKATENLLSAAKQRMEVGSLIQLELDNARTDLKNAERLAQEGTFSQIALERARNGVLGIERRLALEKVDSAAGIASLENALEVKKLRLERMTIKSPVDGQIAEVFAFPGDIIGGEATVVSLISAARTIDAKISEENFAGIKVGDKASVRFLGYGPQLYAASVTKVLPTADPATQRYIVHLSVDIAPEKLVPGLTGEVSIVIDVHMNTLVIPSRAVFGGKVYVAKDGVVELRTVKLGYTDMVKVEVLDGLKEGEEVLIEQLDMMRAGDRIRTRLERYSRTDST